ncbi:protein kinase, partial [Coemansia sp. RSA 2607]
MTVLHAGERDVAEAGGGAVDFSAFEHQKENIQPQPRGRSASALALLYGPTSGSHLADSQQPSRPLAAAPALDGAAGLRLAAHLQAEHARYMAELAATDPHESDDPLDAHFRYVQWLLEVFPQAPGHPSVIRVIERPLREFRGHERYRNDARYLRLWLWYTGLITEGQEAVLQFLVANGIGDSLAALYEEYAKVLESRGRSQKADEVFRLGVARKAQPLARLERRYDEFQRRVMAQTRRDVDNGLLGSGQQPQQQQQQNTQQQQHPASDENHAPGRTMLGTKRSGGAARSAAANTLRPSQRGLPSSGGPASTRPNARISVYADPSGRSDTSARPGDAAWPDIGTHDTRRKENVPAASAWRGQTLAQRPGGTLQPTQKFTVYSDHGDRQAGGASEGARQMGQPGVLSQRSDSAADASSLLLSLDASGAPLPPSQQQQQQLKTTREKPRERMVMPD